MEKSPDDPEEFAVEVGLALAELATAIELLGVSERCITCELDIASRLSSNSGLIVTTLRPWNGGGERREQQLTKVSAERLAHFLAHLLTFAFAFTFLDSVFYLCFSAAKMLEAVGK